MRHWIFRPIVFYPLAALLAVVVILLAFDPFAWRNKPAPQAGVIEDGVIILAGEAFDAPDRSPDQIVTVRREGWGRAVAMRIAVLPNQPAPSPAETGARILLAPETAALIDDLPVHVTVSYASLPTNPAAGLAVSLQGIGPAEWVSQDLPVGEGEVSFDLPPQFAVNAIGLRALSTDVLFNSGVEILSVKLQPGEAATEFIPMEPPPPMPGQE
jgi:hypothetical protein